ncbi:hypothetical protein O3G_MSEX009193 [Manduca sexta]|uniref:RHD domain-containing protein n=2 Tax=Manduca sexta TaxID=7130 RepID=A0A921ZEJ6_MANSE|nr:hypothetical protein O3G_MSEX009193 [Manduca sexta]
MSSCPSDYDPSESSKSPQSIWESGGYSSPSQQVPQLTSNLTELSVDHSYRYNGNGPYLQITEQPQKYFRFRYVSEMVGTHGCLLGKSYTTNKVKTHPTVELVNYTGRALIKCQLSQNKSEDEHPHKLLDEQDRDMSHHVPEHGSYRVVFAGMGIIHTAKKEVAGWLYRKYIQQNKNEKFNKKELEAHCERMSKEIDLNIVRLKFSAHDIDTGIEICRPVFSEPIYNLKCASTNDLKICRISRCYGRPRGGEDIFIFVEKVNKKNIQVRFFRLENGERTWSAMANFLLSDVHHQYAIAFRTPPYVNHQISEDVQVFIELVRPSDGRTSAPMEFTYKAEQIYKQNKKRKTTSSYSSLDSSSGSAGSIKSISELPAPVVFAENLPENNERIIDIPVQQNMLYQVLPSQCDLADAFMEVDSKGSPASVVDPMWAGADGGLQMASSLPAIKLGSTELESLAHRGKDGVPIDKEFFDNYLSSLNSLGELNDDDEINHMQYVRSLQMVHADSARRKAEPQPKDTVTKPTQSSPKDTDYGAQSARPTEYSAYYKMEDGVEVKKLVKELCSIIQNKAGYKKQEVRNKLERLFTYRLSNGDTFLHMTLCSNQSSFEYIVKIIHSVKMTHLLDYCNNKQQTILHMAIVNDLPRMVSLLIAKGCNPMNKDSEGDNAVHYAVRSECCLEALLDAIKNNNVRCDLNDCNNEKQTALHLSTSGASARLLAARGADPRVRDAQGRTPLHLAAYDDNCDVVSALLEFVSPSEIDVVDGCGNTALQIVCGGSVKKNTLEIVKLLLQKKADPLKQDGHNISAWKMAREHSEIRDAMKDYVPAAAYEEDTKSEMDDEFESADEECIH